MPEGTGVWPRVQAAAQNLWDTGLKPLGDYLLTDFAPSVANAFSEAFAPITGDVISAKLQMFADFFVWACGICRANGYGRTLLMRPGRSRRGKRPRSDT